MVDSLNARKGKLSYFDFRSIKKEIKENIVPKNADIVTSDYFQLFDTFLPKNMNDRQNYYMEIASKIALKSVMNHKHGAILVYKKQIISSGYNYYHGENSVHAEIATITRMQKRFRKNLSECEMYVVRIGPNDLNCHLKYSKPCYNCQNFIAKNKIKKTYYSTNYKYDTVISEFLEQKLLNECSKK